MLRWCFLVVVSTSFIVTNSAEADSPELTQAMRDVEYAEPMPDSAPIQVDQYGRPVWTPEQGYIEYSIESADGLVPDPSVNLGYIPVTGEILRGIPPYTDFVVSSQSSFIIDGYAIGAAGILVEDLDKNGESEIVVTAYGGSLRYWYVLAHDDGTYYRKWTSPFYSSVIYSSTLGDWDNNGILDVCVAVGSRILVYDGESFDLLKEINVHADAIYDIQLLDVDGDNLAEFVFCDEDAFYIYNAATGLLEHKGLNFGGRTLAVGNVDEDANLEIIIGDYTSGGFVFDGATLQLDWSYAGGFGQLVRAGDIDDDGIDEVVAATYGRITVFDVDLKSAKYEVNDSYRVCGMRLADVDGDGIDEIVHGEDQWGSIYIRDGIDGAVSWKVRNPEHGVTDVAVGDTDNDGVKDVLWGAGQTSSGEDNLFIADSASQAIQWESLDIHGSFFGMDHGDVDNDGDPELLFTCQSSRSGYGDGYYFVRNANTMRAEYRGDGTGDTKTVLRLVQVDNDPQMEIVVAAGNRLRCYDGISHDLQWEGGENSANAYYSMELGDIDNDGLLDVVAGSSSSYVYVFDSFSGVRTWQSIYLSGNVADLALANIDEDAALEIVAASYYGGVTVYDGSSKLMQWRTADLNVTTVEAVDLNNDNQVEIVIGDEDGCVRELDVTTGTVGKTLWTFQDKIDAMAFADVTLDEVPDLIVCVDNEIIVRDGADLQTVLWRSGVIGNSVGAFDSLVVADIDGDEKTEIVVNLGFVGIQVFQVMIDFDDCNENGVPDIVDIQSNHSNDCQLNGIPDECDIASGTSTDATGNGIPDECDVDCNKNGIPDADDISSGGSVDCQGDGVPDECELALSHNCCDAGSESGCNDSEIESCVCAIDPYCCQVEWDEVCAEQVESLACGSCVIASDCNENGMLDECDIADGNSSDCDNNGTPDECDPDYDRDRVPDACDNCVEEFNPFQENFDNDSLGDVCDNDIDGDGLDNDVDVCDYTPLGAVIETDGSVLGDLDGDCDVDLADFAIMESRFTGPGVS